MERGGDDRMRRTDMMYAILKTLYAVLYMELMDAAARVGRTNGNKLSMHVTLQFCNSILK
jgi:hypothetical protein